MAIFGLAFFGHGMSNMNTDCIASAIDGKDCPTNIEAVVEHHISAWQSLTTTLVQPISNWLSLLAFLLLISIPLFFLRKDLLSPRLRLLPQRQQNLTISAQKTRQKIISWLSLFELSPSL